MKKIIFLLLAMTTGTVQAGNEDFETYGDIFQLAIPGMAAGYSLFTGDKEGLWQFTKGAGTTFLTTHAAKRVFNRKRPHQVGLSNGYTEKWESGGESFWSGHTASAFTGASYVCNRYGFNMACGLSVLAATGVGASRVDSGNHYVTDVIVGAVAGWVSMDYFTNSKGNGVTVKPFANHETGGVQVSFKW